jgi:hypothetical protein
MWPYSTHSSQYGVIAPKPQDWPDFDDFEKADASLKVWLPQILIDRINWVSKQREVSRPNVVRGLAFENVYGRVAYEALIAHVAAKKNSHSMPNTSGAIDQLLHGNIKKSVRRTTQQDLEYIGKSDEDITITVPKKLKVDLIQLANLHKLTPSSYVRKLLVLHLLGEQVHSQWQKALGNLPADLRVLEADSN